MRDAHGEAKVLSGVGWDVTDKKLVEERLLGSQRELQRAHDELEMTVEERTRALVRKTIELERSNADLEQFAYVASHDLQEPLRKISSYGELLQDRYGNALDDRGRRYATYMVDGVRRLQELIRALLEYSRLNRPGEPFAPVQLDDVLDRVLNDMDVTIREARAIIRRKTLPVVWGSAVEIGQVFQNLVSNAVKFRGQRPLQIEVSAEKRGSDWVIRVADNGIGIEPEYREKIFAVFQRLHSRSEIPGAGIGLAICKKIAERHGGQIWVESVAGIGSTFCFTLASPPTAGAGDRKAPGTTAADPARAEGAAA
jgi:light-regulated signal transduction histidine kinase (bacteriophytochrome)